jgi:hypothetical protein
MRTVQNAAGDGWDMGLSDLIEETPAFSPVQPKQFRIVFQQDGTHVYMQRQKPSWSDSRSGQTRA